MNAPSTELNKLKLLFERSKFERGIKVTRSLLQTYPYCGQTWEYCGQFYHQLGLLRLSQCALEVATTLIPLSTNSQIALADCYIDSRHNDIATLIYEHLIEMKQLSTPQLMNVSKCLESLDEHLIAISALKQLDNYLPGFAQNHFKLAQYMADNSYPCSAIELELREAVNLDSVNFDYRIGLAGFLHCCNRNSEAYGLVNDINPITIEAMSCACCLKKLVNVFSIANDQIRFDIGMARLNQLSNT